MGVAPFTFPSIIFPLLAVLPDDVPVYICAVLLESGITLAKLQK